MPYYKISENAVHFLHPSDTLSEDEITYLPPGSVQITDEEAYAIKEAQRIEYENARPYTEKRAAEYPPMVDYLDGIVKGDAAQVQRYIDACLAVKLKYPKPTE
jgi:hypothetical protein